MTILAQNHILMKRKVRLILLIKSLIKLEKPEMFMELENIRYFTFSVSFSVYGLAFSFYIAWCTLKWNQNMSVEKIWHINGKSVTTKKFVQTLSKVSPGLITPAKEPYIIGSSNTIWNVNQTISFHFLVCFTWLDVLLAQYFCHV